MDTRVSNCSSSSTADSKLALIDLPLFLIESILILVVLLVTVAKRLSFNNNNNNITESISDVHETDTHVRAASETSIDCRIAIKSDTLRRPINSW